MKANSRRRVLISSLAMLLVALVALSTATFAWFTTNTSATASGMNVYTVKSSKLEIASATSTWGTLVDYDVDDKALLPASSANGTAWFKADANSESDGSAKAGTYASISDTASYVVKDQLNIRNAGETTINNVTVTISGLTSYARVALVPTTAQGTAVANTGTFANCVFDAEGEAYTPLSAAAAPATDAAQITPNGTATLNVGNLASEAAVYYNLYVWFEGQDTDCNDNTMNIIDDLTFSVTGTPAA